MPNIAALAPGVIGKLRSSTIITSVAEVVEELVCNSIDAGARSVSGADQTMVVIRCLFH